MRLFFNKKPLPIPNNNIIVCIFKLREILKESEKNEINNEQSLGVQLKYVRKHYCKHIYYIPESNYYYQGLCRLINILKQEEGANLLPSNTTDYNELFDFLYKNIKIYNKNVKLHSLWFKAGDKNKRIKFLNWILNQ